MTDEKKYMDFAKSLVGLRHQDVLEVGGCISPEVITDYEPRSWTSIDVNPKRFEGKTTFNGNFTFTAENMSVTDIKHPDNSFDRIFSVNCFEHVDDLKKGMDEMFRVLRPGGKLFTIFGPIWSSPVGHHTWIEYEGHIYHFMNGVFPDWDHLIKTRSELKSDLEERYDEELAENICRYVYDSSDINRLADGDYEKNLKDSNFRVNLRVRKKRGKKPSKKRREAIIYNYPSCNDPTVTEYLLVVSKGKISIRDTFTMYFGLVSQLMNKILQKVFPRSV
ncbi:ubiquinone/menaquinone biosynthesis C-methylase UbiE [Halospina denitrificans]|uniref:Ubiquinone/menaquinone biosynthesis C-methylase UbiE n=1 Tax=Halospina denitrificans TaxID=332522 RepID=A0A4R7JMX9_9GAMM|nr:class I SAM-dependent methyltransferase [Halospina denitrificans]TDT39471.1 ubiquinone/menaquinone biosynthesis C-methylase UbiE [Halospina denitrificans]